MQPQSRIDSDFWRKLEGAAPGLLEMGAGLYGQRAGRKEAAQRLGATPAAAYNDASKVALARAGNMDPRAASQEHFNAAQGLLAGADAKSMDDLMQRLHSSGTMGLGSHSGQQGGPAANPLMAAHMKAKADRDAKMAFDSLGYGDDQIDRQLNRSGMLQGQAAGLRREMPQPSKSAANMNLLKGGLGVLKDTGMLKMGTDWLKGVFSGGGGGNDLGFDAGFGDWWN